MGNVKISVDHDSLDFDYKPHQHMLELENVDDENYQYRLVRRAPDRIRYWKKLGYGMCDEDEGIMVGTGEEPVGGEVVVGGGELVVMKRQREITEQHREHLKKKALKAKRGPTEQFKEKVRRMAGHVGGEAIDTTKERRGPWSKKDDTSDEED